MPEMHLRQQVNSGMIQRRCKNIRACNRTSEGHLTAGGLLPRPAYPNRQLMKAEPSHYLRTGWEYWSKRPMRVVVVSLP